MNLNLFEYSKKDKELFENNIVYININQEVTYFSVCTNLNFYIFRINPFKRIYKQTRKFSIVSMLHNSNIICYISHHNQYKLILYNLKHREEINQIKRNKKIINIKTHNNFIICVYMKMIEIYDNELKLIRRYVTIENEKGLCGVNYNRSNITICFPHRKGGVLRIQKESEANKKILIKAFEENELIDCIAINKNGSLCAVSSIDGVIIKVFNIKRIKKNGSSGGGDSSGGEQIENIPVYEFKRGKWRSEIQSLSFSYHSKFISCTSSNGTLHVFALQKKSKQSNQNQNDIIKNPKSSFSWLSKIGVNMFNYQLSFIQYKQFLPPSIASFGQNKEYKNNIVLITGRGEFINLELNVKEKEFKIIEKRNFYEYLV